MDQDLSNIYSSSVKNRGSLSLGLSNPFSGSPQMERDPALRNLENSVFSKIAELTKEHDIVSLPKVKNNSLRTVSYEEALKELLELEKSNLYQPENSPIS